MKAPSLGDTKLTFEVNLEMGYILRLSEAECQAVINYAKDGKLRIGDAMVEMVDCELIKAERVSFNAFVNPGYSEAKEIEEQFLGMAIDEI